MKLALQVCKPDYITRKLSLYVRMARIFRNLDALNKPRGDVRRVSFIWLQEALDFGCTDADKD